ncbi:MAG: hypothetical protein ACLU3I_02945 [Acutalibacteraceae bacterium]
MIVSYSNGTDFLQANQALLQENPYLSPFLRWMPASEAGGYHQLRAPLRAGRQLAAGPEGRAV